MPPIPITIITGFLGSGKTTLILNLLPQLPTNYRVALLKNEFGDLAVDTQLASSKSISGVRELLNGCICCNLVGQLGDALFQLRDTVDPARIIVETSGSAFPATLAMEINRISNENPGMFVLDGVISVIDVENWKGYDDVSPTARMQARYTDLIIFNKWELVSERRFDEALDRVGDLEVQTPWVKSVKGWVDKEVVLGVDGAMIRQEGIREAIALEHEAGTRGEEHHQSEVEVLSVTLKTEDGRPHAVSLDDFEELLLSAPKDEVYRIKGLIASRLAPPDSTGDRRASLDMDGKGLYVLNWAFGRWTYTGLSSTQFDVLDGASARLTFILARGEATRWKKKLDTGELLKVDAEHKGVVVVEKVSSYSGHGHTH
jgi:G3E family GTPase